MDRALDNKGFLIPQKGDKVYTTRPGIFGLPIRLEGVVVGKSVRITAGPTDRRLASLSTCRWIVKDDPRIESYSRETSERWAREAEEKKNQAEQAGREAAVILHQLIGQSLATGRIPFNPETAKIGDIIYIHFSWPSHGTLPGVNGILKQTLTERDDKGGWYATDTPGQAGGYVGDKIQNIYTD